MKSVEVEAMNVEGLVGEVGWVLHNFRIYILFVKLSIVLRTRRTISKGVGFYGLRTTKSVV